MLAETRSSNVAPIQAMIGDQAPWVALEESLRRLVSRLCVAARGQSEQLDVQIGHVSGAMRRRAGQEELEPLMGELARAIAALDDAPPTSSKGSTGLSSANNATDVSPAGAVVPAAPDVAMKPVAATPAGQIISRLLERLTLEPRLQARVAELKLRLTSADTDLALADAVERTADLINEQLQQFQLDKGEVERTLQQVNCQLDEVASFLFGEDEDRAATQRSGAQLDHEVLQELSSLGERAVEAPSLAVLREEVSSRAQVIQSHLTAFREREAVRVVAYQERADRMRSRIGELERETHALQQTLQREKRLAVTDALTAIPNRLAWDDRLAREFTRWKVSGRPMCLATWDIDRFKSINDTFGHAAGDKVLYVVAQHLAKHVRSTDFLARYGGEEFSMLLPGTSAEEALAVCESVRGMIEKLNFHYRQKAIPVTVSCGITAFERDDTPEAAFERADRALYRAKNDGRNRCKLG